MERGRQTGLEPFRQGSVDQQELIARVQDGDPTAERALYDAHVDRVYGLAYRMTGNEAVAKDCTQDVFVRAFERLDEFRGDAAMSTWLHRITTSVVLNHLRSAKRARKREEKAVQDSLVVTDGPARSEPDLKRDLRRAVDRLGEIYRTVFVMHDVEGFTHREIADALGVAEGTSKARLSRARAELRDALAAYAPGASPAGGEACGGS